MARTGLGARLATGEVIAVRRLIKPNMQTGYRPDPGGRASARNVMRPVSCEFVGDEVVRAVPSAGISVNPCFEFSRRVTGTGFWRVLCADDAGVKGERRQPMPLA